MEYVCRKCGIPLVIGENITQKGVDNYQHICRSCERERRLEWIKNHREQQRMYWREYTHRIGRHQPLSKNKECAQYLGVHVAERVLSHVFKDVEKMPYGNPGYDFICNRGKKIDVKSSCRNHHETKADNWTFHISKNRIPDYFLCLAFDDRKSLNPEHIWLIPGGKISHLVGTGIAETRLDRWKGYKLDIDRVSICCNIIKEESIMYKQNRIKHAEEAL